jgi:hypothetical protein
MDNYKRGLVLAIVVVLAFILFNLQYLGWAVNETPSNVTVSAGNSFPVIDTINSSLFVCEGESMFYEFNASDGDADVLSGSIVPQNPFFVFWVTQYAPNIHQFAIVSATLDKGDVGGVSVGSQLYQETVHITDNFNATCCEDTENTNITIIEINNAPVVENIGVKTIYTQGENSTLYEEWSVNDTEYIDYGYGNLTFNISIINSSGSTVNLFNISSTGVMNFTANSSTTTGVYNVTVCVNDTGLNTTHANISTSCGQSGASFSVCDNFSLTITDENRQPNFTAYYPTNFTINAPDTQTLYFNITTNDLDGTIPDAYWYVDGIFNQLDSGSSFDEFSYVFGCGVSGNHNVSVVITDGLLNNSLNWNITLSLVSCSIPSPGGEEGGGGGGAGSKLFLVQPEFITTTVIQQQGKSFDLTINNTGTSFLNLILATENLTNKAILSDEAITLSPGESKIVKLYLYALSSTAPGVYFGKIVVSEGLVQKEVKIVLEVKEREPLFDVKITVPPEYKSVKAGEDISVIVKMLNVGLYGTAVDVELILYITDLDRVILYETSKEIIAVETNLSVNRILHVPFDARSGTYLVLGDVKYTNISVNTYDTFTVLEKKYLRASYVLLIILVIMLILFLIFILYRRRKRKEERGE